MSNQPSHPSASLIDFVPLIRSPATWAPKPVTLPPDIHPLPDDVSAYFVYPYTLEKHVLSPDPPHVSHVERLRGLDEQHSKRVQFLKDREDEKARKKREQLRKVAPGWEPSDDEAKRSSTVLEPTRKTQKATDPPAPSAEAKEGEERAKPVEKPRDVMDDLVDGLAKLENQ